MENYLLADVVTHTHKSGRNSDETLAADSLQLNHSSKSRMLKIAVK